MRCSGQPKAVALQPSVRVLAAAEAASRGCAEKRQAEAARIRDKYPDRIPVSPSTSCSGRGWRCWQAGLTGELAVRRSLLRRRRRVTSPTLTRRSGLPAMPCHLSLLLLMSACLLLLCSRVWRV